MEAGKEVDPFLGQPYGPAAMLGLAATGRASSRGSEELEEPLHVPDFDLPPGWMGGDEEDGCTNNPIHGTRISIGTTMPVEIPLVPALMEVDDLYADDNSKVCLRERMFSSSSTNSASFLSSEEVSRLLDEIIEESAELNDCIHGEMHEGCWQCSANSEIPAYIEDGNGFSNLQEPIHQAPPQPTIGLSDNVARVWSLPNGQCWKVDFTHGSMQIVDYETQMFKYIGTCGEFLIHLPNIMDPLDGFQRAYQSYEEMWNSEAEFVNLDGDVVDEVEMGRQEEHPKELLPPEGPQDQKDTRRRTPEGRRVGRPQKYQLKEIRQNETATDARERETQERSREKKANRLKRQRDAVKNASGILQICKMNLAKKSKENAPGIIEEMAEALKEHVDFQPGNRKKPKVKTSRKKNAKYATTKESWEARKENGKASAKRFRENEKKEEIKFNKIMEKLPLLEKALEAIFDETVRISVRHAIEILRGAPPYPSSPKKAASPAM